MTPIEQFQTMRAVAVDGFFKNLKKMPVYPFLQSMGIKDFYQNFKSLDGIDLGIFHAYWDNNEWNVRWYPSNTPPSAMANYTKDPRDPIKFRAAWVKAQNELQNKYSTSEEWDIDENVVLN